MPSQMWIPNRNRNSWYHAGWADSYSSQGWWWTTWPSHDIMTRMGKLKCLDNKFSQCHTFHVTSIFFALKLKPGLSIVKTVKPPKIWHDHGLLCVSLTQVFKTFMNLFLGKACQYVHQGRWDLLWKARLEKSWMVIHYTFFHHCFRV